MSIINVLQRTSDPADYRVSIEPRKGRERLLATPVMRRFWRTLLVGLTASSVLTTLTQDILGSEPSEWTTVADEMSASATDVTTDSLGSVIVAGQLRTRNADGTTTYSPIISKSSTHTTAGEDWINHVYPEGSSFSTIAAADIQTEGIIEHHVVAAGNYLGAENGGWIVSRSLDGGQNWETLDRFTHGGTYFSPKGVALDSAGNIYVVGDKKVVTKRSTTFVSLVRRLGRNPGEEPKTFELPFAARATGVTCVGTDVFVCGGSGDLWQVLKSSNGGANWVVVDSFRYAAKCSSSAWGITADSSGNLFVSGRGYYGNRGMFAYAVVRKGSAGTNGTGTLWSTIGTFDCGKSTETWAPDVAVDHSGNVHVVGSAVFPDTTVRHWFAAQGTETSAGWQWSLTDHVGFAANKSSTGQEIAVDPSGNVFATGQAYDSADVYHSWLVRRRLAPPPTDP